MKRYIFVLLSFILISGCFSPAKTYYQDQTAETLTIEQIEQYEKNSSFDSDNYIWEDFQQQ